LTARRYQFTQTALTPPPHLIATGGKLILHGTVTNTTAGRVLVVVTGPKGFVKLGKVVELSAGKFAWTLEPKLLGLYHVRVTYPGDTGHQPSKSLAYAVQVAS
jgi:acylphosphatase